WSARIQPAEPAGMRLRSTFRYGTPSSTFLPRTRRRFGPPQYGGGGPPARSGGPRPRCVWAGGAVMSRAGPARRVGAGGVGVGVGVGVAPGTGVWVGVAPGDGDGVGVGVAAGS